MEVKLKTPSRLIQDYFKTIFRLNLIEPQLNSIQFQLKLWTWHYSAQACFFLNFFNGKPGLCGPTQSAWWKVPFLFKPSLIDLSVCPRRNIVDNVVIDFISGSLQLVVTSYNHISMDFLSKSKAGYKSYKFFGISLNSELHE